jgi:hypothetical protein
VKGFLIRTVSLAGMVGLLFGLTQCKREPDRPASVLTEAEMVQVLMDIYIGEEKVNRLALSRDSAEVVFDALNERIMQKHGTSDSIVSISLNYYLNRPKELEKIYAIVIDSLQLQEQRSPEIVNQ